MNELLPGVVHWTAQHERIRIDVSSYYLVRERVAIDPTPPMLAAGVGVGRALTVVTNGR